MNIEIINLIFNYIWYSDLNNTRLVCKKWNNAISNNYQYKRIVVDQLNNIFNIKNKEKIFFRSEIHPKKYFFFLKLLPDDFFDFTFLEGSNKINIDGNTIFFDGLYEGGDRIVFLNRSIPKGPFILPIVENNSCNLYLSNIYYFEIEVNTNQFRNGWDNECISIGFCNRKVNSSCIGYQVGWIKGSFGYHSDDGGIFTETGSHHSQGLNDPWGPGDVVGAGILFFKNKIKIFFTKNGKFLGFFANKNIKNQNYNLTPAISIDSSYPVSVNFGQNQFKFCLKNMVLDYYKKPSNTILNNHYLKNNAININQIKYYDKDDSDQDEDHILEQISSNFLQNLMLEFMMVT